jgi:hypothetical protein
VLVSASLDVPSTAPSVELELVPEQAGNTNSANAQRTVHVRTNCKVMFALV